MSGSRQDRPSAAYPFDIEDADVVFTTSDGVEFRVYKAILAVASPFFRDMFSLKQPTVGASEPITVAEDSKIFDALLRLCYPVDDPALTDLSQLELILEAAMKYQLSQAEKLCRASLVTLIPGNSLRVLAIACRLGADQEARQAAELWMKNNRWNESSLDFRDTLCGKIYQPEMADIPAARFFRTCYAFRYDTFRTASFATPGNPCNHGFQYQGSTSRIIEPLNYGPFSHDSTTDIELQTTDSVRVRAHALLFRLSGAQRILDEGIPLLMPGAPRPIIQVPLSNQTLVDLLCAMAPPACSPGITDPGRLLRLAQVAARHELSAITASLKRETRRLISENSFAMYLIASASGWAKEAELAARALADRSLDAAYDPVMEDVPASVYYALRKFHHQCIPAVKDVVDRELRYHEGPHDARSRIQSMLNKRLSEIKLELPTTNVSVKRVAVPTFS